MYFVFMQAIGFFSEIVSGCISLLEYETAGKGVL